MKNSLKKFVKSKIGVIQVEYGFIAFLVGMASIFVAVGKNNLHDATSKVYVKLASGVEKNNPKAPAVGKIAGWRPPGWEPKPPK